ncbi:MAG: class I SAM-dependent methyltransferase [Bacteroidota bacterium]
MKPCLVCGTTDFSLVCNNKLLRCNSCNFVMANLEVIPETLQQVYTENYFKGEEYVDYFGDKEILQTNFKKRLQQIYKLIDKRTITNVIEIGCAYGFFAEVLNNDLKNIKYVGYDIVPEVIKYGSKQLKQNIICSDYLEAKIEAKASDIFMWDVIEHLINPDKFIEKAAADLKPGGRIYITTGDIERFLPRLQKDKWRMIHPPSHLYYFSKKTLSRLLEQYGFRIVNVSYPSVSRSIRQIFYSLFMLRKRYPGFVKKIYNGIPGRANMLVNTYDILFLIAEKK